MKNVVMVTKKDCTFCEDVKKGLGDDLSKVRIVDAYSSEAIAIFLDNEMYPEVVVPQEMRDSKSPEFFSSIPLPFVEVDGEFLRECYKWVKDKNDKNVLSPVRMKLVKDIKKAVAEA